MPFCILVLSAALPVNAEIKFSAQHYPDPALNPAPSAAVVDLVKQAVQRLAADPRLANHPVGRSLNDPAVLVKIIFDNPGAIVGAKVVNHNEIHISSEKDYPYYLVTLAHEFVHIGVVEKYGDALNYTFLPPADFAFLNLMEEAFANALGLWIHLSYPEIPKNSRARYYTRHNSHTAIADAMCNDLIAFNPQFEMGIHDKVAGEMFNLYMTSTGTYTLIEIPRNMAIAYGQRNTFLIPEYDAYRAHSDALLRHIWNYLSSMMPFRLPGHMTYDYYRNMFMNWVTFWNAHARSREHSILYWINYDAKSAARAKLAARGENERVYDYLPRADEARLNRVMREINPAFIPVDTSRRRSIHD
jgi:hypothetical protein